VNFTLYSERAERVGLCLFEEENSPRLKSSTSAAQATPKIIAKRVQQNCMHDLKEFLETGRCKTVPCGIYQ